MKFRIPLAIAALTVTGLVVGPASPASADGTEANFTLSGGSLTLAVEGTATLTAAAPGATSITGNLGAVTVTETRGETGNWTVSAASTAFTGARATPSSSTAVSYNAGSVTETGTITVADGGATTLTGTAATVVAPTSLSGNNTASWNPALTVTMPASALVDTYTGTITTSIT